MALARRLALATGAATLLLIVAGGLVTNTGAGLAVPDWPTTFGHNMFTYPWSGMVGGIFFEHSHRLIGALVGLLTLGLAAALWPAGGGLRALGLVAVGAVVVQGVLGGLRVVLLEGRLAVLHGCLAQAFFGLVVAIAVLTGPDAAVLGSRIAVTPAVRRRTLLAAAVVYLQIVLGAVLTHLGYLELHLAGALAVFAVVPMATAAVRRAADASARGLARALLAVLGVQLLLGAGAWVGRFTEIVMPAGAGLAIPVAHRVAGSAILGLVVALAVRARLARAAAPESAPGDPGLAPAGRSAR